MADCMKYKWIIIIVAILLIVVAVYFIVAQDSPGMNLVGTWQSEGKILTMNEDGTGTYAENGTRFIISWEFSDAYEDTEAVTIYISTGNSFDLSHLLTDFYTKGGYHYQYSVVDGGSTLILHHGDVNSPIHVLFKGTVGGIDV